MGVNMRRFNKGLLLELLCVSFALGGLAQYFEGPSVLTPIEVVGRVEFSNVSIMFDWSGIHFTLNFTGCGLRLQIFEQQSRGNYYSVYVDGCLSLTTFLTSLQGRNSSV